MFEYNRAKKIAGSMEWEYAKPLDSNESINLFEVWVRYNFPRLFKICVQTHNGGRPARKAFTTNKKERHIKTFLSFNKTDKETVWKAYEALEDNLKQKYLPFAIISLLKCQDLRGKTAGYCSLNMLTALSHIILLY